MGLDDWDYVHMTQMQMAVVRTDLTVNFKTKNNVVSKINQNKVLLDLMTRDLSSKHSEDWTITSCDISFNRHTCKETQNRIIYHSVVWSEKKDNQWSLCTHTSAAAMILLGSALRAISCLTRSSSWPGSFSLQKKKLPLYLPAIQNLAVHFQIEYLHLMYNTNKFTIKKKSKV